MFVIARNSTFTYKGKPVKVQQISRDLGVRYILEGSVQKAGDRLRVTAQLVDSTTGNHIWAERYDRELKDNPHLIDRFRETTTRFLERGSLSESSLILDGPGLGCPTIKCKEGFKMRRNEYKLFSPRKIVHLSIKNRLIRFEITFFISLIFSFNV